MESGKSKVGGDSTSDFPLSIFDFLLRMTSVI
jgi:hypothetical protein